MKPENIATSGEVYALYSDARRKIRDRDVTHYDEALGELKRVVEMDPNFAPDRRLCPWRPILESINSSQRVLPSSEKQRVPRKRIKQR